MNELKIKGLRVTESAIARFWEKVAIKGDADCWEWEGGKTGSGYGAFYPFGRGAQIGAHRFAMLLESGRLNEGGEVVLHSCDNPSCCNPAHLSFGSYKDNTRDMVSKGRNIRGVRHPISKLDAGQVREIRRRHSGGESMRSLARNFPVTRTRIREIVTGRAWKHV